MAKHNPDLDFLNCPHLSEYERSRILADQDAFLAAYLHAGSIYSAAPAAGVSRHVVQNWERDNVLGFKERFQVTEREFAESLQDLAVERVRNPEKGVGTDWLLDRQLQVHWPEKYKPLTQPIDETARAVIAEIRKLAQLEKQAGTRVIEGEVIDPTMKAIEERFGAKTDASE